MKIITVWNRKGGVGKTTISFNLASALATEHQKRVLVLDLDEQMNLSLMIERTSKRSYKNIAELAECNFRDMKKEQIIDGLQKSRALIRRPTSLLSTVCMKD